MKIGWRDKSNKEEKNLKENVNWSSGVLASDLHTWVRGPSEKPPRQPQHQAHSDGVWLISCHFLRLNIWPLSAGNLETKASPLPCRALLLREPLTTLQPACQDGKQLLHCTLRNCGMQHTGQGICITVAQLQNPPPFCWAVILPSFLQTKSSSHLCVPSVTPQGYISWETWGTASHFTGEIKEPRR